MAADFRIVTRGVLIREEDFESNRIESNKRIIDKVIIVQKCIDKVIVVQKYVSLLQYN